MAVEVANAAEGEVEDRGEEAAEEDVSGAAVDRDEGGGCC